MRIPTTIHLAKNLPYPGLREKYCIDTAGIEYTLWLDTSLIPHLDDVLYYNYWVSLNDRINIHSSADIIRDAVYDEIQKSLSTNQKYYHLVSLLIPYFQHPSSEKLNSLNDIVLKGEDLKTWMDKNCST